MVKRIFCIVTVCLLLALSVLPCVAAIPSDVPSLVQLVDFSQFSSGHIWSDFGDNFGVFDCSYDSNTGALYVESTTAEFTDFFGVLVFDEYNLAEILPNSLVGQNLYACCYIDDSYGIESMEVMACDIYGNIVNIGDLSEAEWEDNYLALYFSSGAMEQKTDLVIEYLMVVTKNTTETQTTVSSVAELIWTPYNSAYFEVDNSDASYQEGYNQALQDIENRLEENGYIDAYMLNYTSSITYSGNFAGSPSMAYAIPTVIGDSISFASSVAAVQQALNNSNISISQLTRYTFEFRVDQRTALPVSEELLPVITADAFTLYSPNSASYLPLPEVYLNYYNTGNTYVSTNLTYSYDQSNNRYMNANVTESMLGGRLVSIVISISSMSSGTDNPVSVLSGLQLSFGSMKGINSTYQSGFEKGYVEGTKVTVGEAVENAYQDGFRVGREEGYLTGKNEGLQLANNGGFRDLIGAVVEVPINAFNSLFNFTILGMNMRAFFGSILSLCVIIIILKKVI